MRALSRIAATSVAISVCMAFAHSAQAAGSADAGKAKAVICQACHGVDGNSVNPEWPSLAGQHASYLANQLRAYKKGARENILMSSQATVLSERDIEDLAAYYSSLSAKTPGANPDLASAGERIYRGGNQASGVSACGACHGPAGHGNPSAGIPSLSGQHATYTAAQLRAYAATERKSDLNQMMRNVAARLSASEIEAVATYIQGLR